MFKTLTAGVALVAASAFFFAACSRPAPGGPVELSIASPRAVVVTGLSSAETDALTTADLGRVLRVRVSGSDVTIAGSHAVSAGRLEFTPAFPFDAGRDYTIDLNFDAMPVHRAAGVLSATRSLPAPDRTPVTRILGMHPTADLWPANLLRAYIHFSAPMGNDSGVEHIVLRDDTGAEVRDAFLPLDADFWNAEHTRYTVFFDPGRVKRGILPNRSQGRALVAGKRYRIEVDATWRDASGRPLTAAFAQDFTVGPAIEAPLSVDAWKISAPGAGARSALVVEFPWPIDYALAERALGVSGTDGQSISGTAELTAGDRRWTFTPSQPWAAGEYRLTAQPVLEDPSGNQVGRAFEVDMRRTPATPPSTPRERLFTINER